MSTQFVNAEDSRRESDLSDPQRWVANRFFGGVERGCVVEWRDENLPEDTVLRGTDGTQLTVAELRSWEGRGKGS